MGNRKAWTIRTFLALMLAGLLGLSTSTGYAMPGPAALAANPQQTELDPVQVAAMAVQRVSSFH